MNNRTRLSIERLEDRTVPSCLCVTPEMSDLLHGELGDALFAQAGIAAHVTETRGEIAFNVPDIDCQDARDLDRLHPSQIITPHYEFHARGNSISLELSPMPEGVSIRIVYDGSFDGYANGAVEQFAVVAGRDVSESIRIPDGDGIITIELTNGETRFRAGSASVNDGRVLRATDKEGDIKAFRYARCDEESEDEEEVAIMEFGGGEDEGGMESGGEDGGNDDVETAEQPEPPQTEVEEVERDAGSLFFDGEPDGDTDGELDGQPDGELDPQPRRMESTDTGALDAVFAADYLQTTDTETMDAHGEKVVSASSLDVVFAESAQESPFTHAPEINTIPVFPLIEQIRQPATSDLIGTAAVLMAPALLQEAKKEPEKQKESVLSRIGGWLKKWW